MKTKIIMIVLGVLCFCGITHAQETPRLKIEKAPVIGKGSTIYGEVILDKEKYNYSDFRVTMTLQVERGGRMWGPKPFGDMPSVSINKSGNFTCLFVTGGNDGLAETLYVYLIPKGFTPTSNTDRTEAAAIDKVVINRYKNGKVEIQHSESESKAIPEADNTILM